jgi:K+-sensing histidine kinase KdpD
MTNTPKTIFIEHPPWNQCWVWFAFGAVFAALDFIAGPLIQFPLFFILPIMFMAWTNGSKWAVILAVILCLIRFSFYFWWDVAWTVGLAVINGLIRCTVLVALSVITARLAALTRRLREQVQTLEGILPICAFCKNIRDENGEWQQMEAYVSHHSQARFSHGVCPNCSEKHYGEALRKLRSKNT